MASFYRRQVLKEALNIAWRKKYLWFIGFFAGLVAYGGEADFFFRNVNAIDTLQNWMVGIRETVKAGDADVFISLLKNFVANNPTAVLGYIAVLALIMAVFAWIIIVSQATLVRVFGQIWQKKPTGIADGLAAGTTKFWPLLVLNIINKLFTWAFLILLAVVPATVYFLSGKIGYAIFASVGWILVTIPISIIVSFLMKFASAYIVIKNESSVQSIRSAWNLFRNNWLVSLELAALIYLINLIIVTVTASIALFIVPTVTFVNSAGVTVTTITQNGFFMLVGILAVVLGYLTTFSYAAWTIVFLRLLEGKPESKLSHWTTSLVNFAGPKKISQ